VEVVELLYILMSGHVFTATIGNPSSSSLSSSTKKAWMNVFFTLIAECPETCLPNKQVPTSGSWDKPAPRTAA